jgi:hypothetical protein
MQQRNSGPLIYILLFSCSLLATGFLAAETSPAEDGATLLRLEIAALNATYSSNSTSDGENFQPNIGINRNALATRMTVMKEVKVRSWTLNIETDLMLRQQLIGTLWKKYQPFSTPYEYVPLALHYGDRIYQLKVDGSYQITPQWTFHLPVKFALHRSGANLWRQAGRVTYQLKTETEFSQFAPMVKFSPQENSSFGPYLLFEKQIDYADRRLSYQTFGKRSSWGVKGEYRSDKHALLSTLNYFHHELFTNDVMRDLSRDGIMGSMLFYGLSRFSVGASFAYARDQYRGAIMSFNRCESIAGGSSNDVSMIYFCKPRAARVAIRPFVSIFFPDLGFISASYSHRSNNYGNLKLLEHTTDELLITFSTIWGHAQAAKSTFPSWSPYYSEFDDPRHDASRIIGAY